MSIREALGIVPFLAVVLLCALGLHLVSRTHESPAAPTATSNSVAKLRDPVWRTPTPTPGPVANLSVVLAATSTAGRHGLVGLGV